MHAVHTSNGLLSRHDNDDGTVTLTYSDGRSKPLEMVLTIDQWNILTRVERKRPLRPETVIRTRFRLTRS